MTQWKPVSRCLNYEVSNEGRVRRVTRGSGTNVGRVLRTAIGTQGYPVIQLWENGKAIFIHVHVLVAEAFLGSRPLKHDVNHIDGVKTNNNCLNLEYVTRTENMRHAVRIGLPIGRYARGRV